MRVSRWLATLGGVGWCPGVPGTAGTLVTWCVAAPLGLWCAREVLWVFWPVVMVVGFWSSGYYARSVGRGDPSEVVIDESAGIWTALVLVPVDLWSYVAAFVLFRCFDMLKPWPVGLIDRRVGGCIGDYGGRYCGGCSGWCECSYWPVVVGGGRCFLRR